MKSELENAEYPVKNFGMAKLKTKTPYKIEQIHIENWLWIMGFSIAYDAQNISILFFVSYYTISYLPSSLFNVIWTRIWERVKANGTTVLL